MKTILVALDGSSIAPVVLERAVQLARLEGARLVLLRVATLFPAQAGGIHPVPQPQLEHELLETAARDIAALEQRVPEELRKTTRVVLNTPWRGICAVANEEEADLVVIGSHGYNPIERLLGTTASGVVHACERSVLVVRPPMSRRARVRSRGIL